jgi:uncharacterized membrane protein
MSRTGRSGGVAGRPLPLVLVLLALLGWCALLIGFRVHLAGERTYAFLLWNLVLAAVPLAAAYALEGAARKRMGAPAQVAAFLIWLCFLPNAPYLLTDLLHLADRPPVPLWFDLAMLLSCAGTGLLLGFLSVARVQRVIDQRFGFAAGWTTALAALLLSGYGIYLGRFLRWNSWDVVADPRGVFGSVAGHLVDPASHPRTLGVTTVYGVGLALAYLALRVAWPAGPPHPRDDETAR